MTMHLLSLLLQPTVLCSQIPIKKHLHQIILIPVSCDDIVVNSMLPVQCLVPKIEVQPNWKDDENSFSVAHNASTILSYVFIQKLVFVPLQSSTEFVLDLYFGVISEIMYITYSRLVVSGVRLVLATPRECGVLERTARPCPRHSKSPNRDRGRGVRAGGKAAIVAP